MILPLLSLFLCSLRFEVERNDRCVDCHHLLGDFSEGGDPDKQYGQGDGDDGLHGEQFVDDGTSSNETRLGAVKDIQFTIEKLNLDDDMLVIAGERNSTEIQCFGAILLWQ